MNLGGGDWGSIFFVEKWRKWSVKETERTFGLIRINSWRLFINMFFCPCHSCQILSRDFCI